MITTGIFEMTGLHTIEIGIVYIDSTRVNKTFASLILKSMLSA
jgi:hypothetical protein